MKLHFLPLLPPRCPEGGAGLNLVPPLTPPPRPARAQRQSHHPCVSLQQVKPEHLFGFTRWDGLAGPCPDSWASSAPPHAGRTRMVGTLGVLAGAGLALTFLPPPPCSCPDRGQGARGCRPQNCWSPQSLSLVPTCPTGQMREGKEAGLGPGRRLMTLRGPNLRQAAAERLRLAPGGG